MRRLALALLAGGLIAASPALFSRESQLPDLNTAQDDIWTNNEKAIAVMRGYLDRMDLVSTMGTLDEKPVLKVPFNLTNATHNLLIMTDGKNSIVYAFLNRYLVVKPDHPRLPEILAQLMQENWRLNIGKFEWDKSDGEVRFSYCFSTENGIGFEAFKAVISTLVKTADERWPELKALVGE